VPSKIRKETRKVKFFLKISGCLNFLRYKAPESILYHISVYIAKSDEAPGLKENDLIFLQQLERLLQFFPEKVPAETHFAQDGFGVFKHGRTVYGLFAGRTETAHDLVC